ncbi:MAG: hypothetical protein HGA23_12415, partial [Bacteroidales bacterium]|nr:hypothetical protein [Bacteroidales bacterium]
MISFTLIMIGYSSYAIIVIRSNANPPMDQNNPDDVFNLLYYLNREKYGDRPLLYGQYYNAPQDKENPYSDGTPFYVKDLKKGKYVMTDDRKSTIPNYDKAFSTIFPRMWSNQKPSHISAYKSWGKIKGTPIDVVNDEGKPETLYKPTMVENVRFFLNYQVGHMYMRYFFWNFVGRQNDIEGHGGIRYGNWLSGIPAIDNARLGDQSNLPDSMQNAANNKFYFLPLLLGLLGLFLHLRKHTDGFL